MSANRFLPPPVRLSQAFESKNFSGGASGSEITRRSFLKRTGGATVATLVAWDVANQIARATGEPTLGSFATSGSWFITCIGVPAALVGGPWIEGGGTTRVLFAELKLDDPNNPQLGETRPAAIGFQITAKLIVSAIPPQSIGIGQNLEVTQGVVGIVGSSVPIFLDATVSETDTKLVERPNEHVKSDLAITSGFIQTAKAVWTNNNEGVIHQIEVSRPNTNEYGEQISDIYGYSFFVHP